jgi:hypothetical protein
MADNITLSLLMQDSYNDFGSRGEEDIEAFRMGYASFTLC